MPDLDTLFADFRTEAPAEIVPPGAARARQTVARRRVVGRAATAVAVLALAATGSMTALSLRGGDVTAPPAAPTLDESKRRTLAEYAMGVLGFSVVGVEPQPGVVYGPVESGERSYQLDSSDQPFPAGTYTMRAACAGEGTVSVQARFREGSAVLQAVCQAGVTAVEFALPERSAGSLTVIVTPDERAKDRAGFAVALTDPREIRVRAMAPDELGSDAVLVTAQEATQRISVEQVVPAGTSRLTVYCAGAGSLHATLDIEGAANTVGIDCPWAGSFGSVTVTTSRPFEQYTVILTMTGGAAYAYFYVERVG